MEVATLKAERRTALGTNKVRYLRGERKIPAVVYGGEASPEHVAIDAHAMQACLRKRLKVYKLQGEGGEQPTFLKDIQWDVLTDQPLHLDFLRIDMNTPIQLRIELTFIGHPVGAAQGGRLVKDLPVVRLSCMPETIPQTVEVNVGPLDLAGRILASELELPKGCSLAIPADAVICRITGGE